MAGFFDNIGIGDILGKASSLTDTGTYGNVNRFNPGVNPALGMQQPSLSKSVQEGLLENVYSPQHKQKVTDFANVPSITSMLDNPSSFLTGDSPSLPALSGYGDSNMGIAQVNPLSVSGAEGQYIAGSAGTAGGPMMTEGPTGRGAEEIKSNNWGKYIPGVLSSLAQASQQPKRRASASVSMAPGLGYGAAQSQSPLKNRGVLGDTRKGYSGVLSNF